MNSIEAKKERNAVHQELKGIYQKAQREDRDLTKAEKDKFKDLDQKFDDLTEKVLHLESIEQKEATLAGREGRIISDDTQDNEVRRGFSDPRTGANLRSYRKGENICEKPPVVGFGEIARAYIGGVRNELEERAMSEGTTTAGGFSVPEVVGKQVFDQLRDHSAIFKMGANVIPLQSDSNIWVKITSDNSNTAWKAENAELTEGDVTIGAVNFTPYTLRSIVLSSQELVQDSINLPQILQTSFVNQFSEKIDTAALYGAGSGSDEPLGITNYSTGLNTATMGANGGKLGNFSELLDLWKAVRSDKANVNGILMSPRTIADISDLSDTTNQPLMAPKLLSDIPWVVSSSVSDTVTKGTATSATSQIFMADWTKLYLGVRLNITIQPLKERYAEFYQYGFLAAMRLDIQPIHNAAFGVLDGILDKDYSAT